MAVIPVSLAGRPYDVRVAPGLLADAGAQCNAVVNGGRIH